MNQDEAMIVALKAFAHIASDGDLLDRFMMISGADADAMCEGARDPAFMAGVLDFLLGNDAVVTAFCEGAEIAPETPMRARAALPGAAPEWS
jgi:hypothetical protein